MWKTIKFIFSSLWRTLKHVLFLVYKEIDPEDWKKIALIVEGLIFQNLESSKKKEISFNTLITFFHSMGRKYAKRSINTAIEVVLLASEIKKKLEVNKDFEITQKRVKGHVTSYILNPKNIDNIIAGITDDLKKLGYKISTEKIKEYTVLALEYLKNLREQEN